MPSTINAQTTPFAAIVQTADNTGNLAFQTANVTAVTITTSQNVGIGTASPQKKLSVSNNGAVGLEIDPTGRSGEAATSLLSYNRSTSAYVPAQYDASQHEFKTSNTERMRIDSSGNLGLGTSSPDYRFISSVSDNTAYSSSNMLATGTAAGFYNQGTAGSGSTIRLGVSGATAISAIYISTGNSALAFGTRASSSDVTERMRLDSSGNLGLGVTPSAWNTSSRALQIGSTAAAYTYGGNFGVTNNLYLSTAGNTTYTTTAAASMLYQDTAGGFRFYQAASGTAGTTATLTQAMTLDASGQLGIGQVPNASQGKLQVNHPVGGTINGALRITDNATTSFVFNNTSAGVSGIWTSGVLTFGTGSGTNTERMRIDSSGNVGIGTSTLNGAKLVVNQGTDQSPATSGNMTTGMMVQSGSGSAALNFGTDSDGAWYNAAYANNAGVARIHRWLTGGTERLRIGTSGQIGIGGANYGTSGQVLTSGGSGAAPSWATLTTGKLLKATVMYNSTTRTTGTNSTFWGTIGGVNVYYNNAAMMSGSFTKQSATSIVVFHINWNIRGGINGHGIHGALFWKDTGVYWPFNEDFGNTSGSNNISRGFVAVIGGLAVGSHTFYMSGTRGDTTAAQWALNPNQEGASLDLAQGQSTMIAYEIEV